VAGDYRGTRGDALSTSLYAMAQPYSVITARPEEPILRRQLRPAVAIPNE